MHFLISVSFLIAEPLELIEDVSEAQIQVSGPVGRPGGLQLQLIQKQQQPQPENWSPQNNIQATRRSRWY